MKHVTTIRIDFDKTVTAAQMHELRDRIQQFFQTDLIPFMDARSIDRGSRIDHEVKYV